MLIPKAPVPWEIISLTYSSPGEVGSDADEGASCDPGRASDQDCKRPKQEANTKHAWPKLKDERLGTEPAQLISSKQGNEGHNTDTQYMEY